jgi:hypothetical protein
LLIFRGKEHPDLSDDQGWDRFRDIVACVVECGIPWALQAWHSLHSAKSVVQKPLHGPTNTESESEQTGAKEPNSSMTRQWAAEDIRGPVLETLVQRHITLSQEDILILLNFLVYLSERSIINSMKRAARIITSRSGDCGLINFTDERYTLAVPRCLPDASSFPSGLWILDRIATSEPEIKDLSRPSLTQSSPPSHGKSCAGPSSWRLIRKALLLGCPLIHQDGETTVLAQRQRVYGPLKAA